MFGRIFVGLSLALFFLATACSKENGNDTQDVVETAVTDVSSDPGAGLDTNISDKIETSVQDIPVTADLPTGDIAQDVGIEVSTTVDDPAPTFTTPGSYEDGTACPGTDITVFEVDAGNATSYTFTGTMIDADGNGKFYVAGPNSEKIDGTIPTTDGNYSVTIPLFCGVQTVKLIWENETCRRVVVLAVTRSGCEGVDIQITLTWDASGNDWELHLVKEGGQINDNATDCTWTSMNPDWGTAGDTTDNPQKDVDDTNAYGPENIYYSNPESGTYTVMVEHWKNGSPESDGQVILNVAGSLTVVPITDLVYMHVRTAATIAWPSGVVIPIGSDYDCSASWSNGCVADIP